MSGHHLITRLAEFATSVNPALSDRSKKVVRDALIDTFGCILAGSSEEVHILSRDVLVGNVKDGESVFGTIYRADLETAALLNAVAGHALDYDDWEIPGNTHISNILLPVLLAASERNILAGKDFIDAYVVGYEVIARLGEAINYDHYIKGWHATGTLAAIGGAAAVARLWNLDQSKTENALSICVSKASGFTRQFGSHAKSLQAGFAAENAIRSARLARGGLTGQTNILEGSQGYFELTGHNDEQRYRQPFENLHDDLAIEEHGLVIKPYPCCAYTHRIIDCAKQLKSKTLDVNSIASVQLYLPDFHGAILPFGQPSSRKDAMFSLPFCAAMSLIHGDLSLDDLDEDSWNNEDIKRLIAITEVSPFALNNPQLNYDPEQPDKMEIIMCNGEIHSATQVYPLGSPQNPLSEKNLLDKFWINASRFREPSNDQVDELLEWPDSKNILEPLCAIGI